MVDQKHYNISDSLFLYVSISSSLQMLSFDSYSYLLLDESCLKRPDAHHHKKEDHPPGSPTSHHRK
jgi:hypothetical protein